MRKTAQLLATRTEQAPPPELPLRAPEAPPPAPLPRNRPADRIKDALLRWLEEEL
ncbi:hypothetical protein [Anaeromyxobacter sp. PSR-1]|uniref:hypothetical protein n=1 Tax=unclassified Anaeromyxobacter TaxID=2620896 RepID=UPI0005DC0959|nr:hypothetical protein [Anaeromyxobacter sp. PSR-1]GAO02790.1 hypothetical protein PSR1_01664 [Anaeromyxobacter sp. PSR-1]